ncbi:MAG TPA: hypothetical protein VH165_29145 [Kofleriaceae bacterium]|jgi:hypothetical protein|nr:hypothetical protein [Kofleriaceae bacterium]
MTHLSSGGTALLLVAVMSTAAWADEPAAAPEAPAAAPAVHPMHTFTGEKTVFYMSGSASDSPFFTVGTTFAPGISIAIGGSFKYDGNGLPDATGKPTTDKVSFQGLIYGAYYIYNKFPVGIAAEAALISPLSPSAFDVVTIQPGLVMYYAPFAAPLVIGSALDLQINVFKGDIKPQVSTVTPGLRLIYVFP